MRLLARTVEIGDWDKFNTYVGSGATGNVLGGLVKPTVGSLSRGQLFVWNA